MIIAVPMTIASAPIQPIEVSVTGMLHTAMRTHFHLPDSHMPITHNPVAPTLLAMQAAKPLLVNDHGIAENRQANGESTAVFPQACLWSFM